MAELPFKGYDTMSVDQVREEMARRFAETLGGFRAVVQAALDFENTTNAHDDELLQTDLDLELSRLKKDIQEGTDRWGGLDKG